MRRIVGDAFYWVTLINPADQHAASALASTLSPPWRVPPLSNGAVIVTTLDVLTEVPNCFSERGQRKRRNALEVIRFILDAPHVQIVEGNLDDFLAGMAVYEDRPDKGYSLTDCLFMAVMRVEGLRKWIYKGSARTGLRVKAIPSGIESYRRWELPVRDHLGKVLRGLTGRTPPLGSASSTEPAPDRTLAVGAETRAGRAGVELGAIAEPPPGAIPAGVGE